MTDDRPQEALAQAYEGITRTVDGLTDLELQRFTRCRGWLVVDVLFHVLCDAQRALVALASPVDGPADVDHVSYWRAGAPGNEDAGARHAWWVRRSTGAFERPAGVVRLWTDTAPAVVRAGRAADPRGFVTTQGHVLRVPDLLDTLTTEAVIHHLDLSVELPDAPQPHPLAVAVAVATLDGLLGGPDLRPATWSDAEYLLKATGRLPLANEDRSALGAAAESFPLLS